jgi:UDP-GlcNAc3NAcA epimerase
MKIATVVGARPQFIKASVLSRLIQNDHRFHEVIIHTGQHYDKNMSDIFFDELHIPHPKYNLEVGSGLHGEQTAKMLQRIEEVLLIEKPDMLIVYGDTNSTVAGSLAASKLHIPVAHVEAGLRSFNRMMPEEINRIVTDHISDILFAPTQNAMNLLSNEGLADKSFLSGDIMYDSVLYYRQTALEKYHLTALPFDEYYLATIHRQENTDDAQKLQQLFTAFSNLDKSVLLPLHPRTRKLIEKISYSKNIRIIDPVGYLELLHLLSHSSKVLTDSGGLQKEAFFLSKPCITLRDETEWIETLDNGWNYVVGCNVSDILEKATLPVPTTKNDYFGDGHAGEKILGEVLTKQGYFYKPKI